MLPRLFKNETKGFTLIEVIIYVVLFSILMGSAFTTAYQLTDNSGKLSVENTTQEEGSFVMRKIDWALTGVQTLTTPTSGTSSTLKLTKYGGNTITIDRIAAALPIPAKFEINESAVGGGPYPITTDNVSADSILFTYIAPSGTGPAGITATAKINGIDFIITKYIRK